MAGPAFRCDLRAGSAGEAVVHQLEYRSLSDRVPPERVPDHLRALDDLADLLTIHLSTPEPREVDPGLSRPTALLWIGIAALTVLAHYAIRRTRPR